MRAVSLLLCLLAAPAIAWAQPASPMLQALRARDFAAANRLAGDGLGQKLVTFVRLLMPDQAGAQEILDFIKANPGWPDQKVLEQRFSEAVAGEPDEKVAAGLCRAHTPVADKGLLRCAEAYAAAGDTAHATAAARAAWVGGLVQPEDEAAFLVRWRKLPTEADQRRRFDRLETANDAAAQRQVSRLGPDDAHLAAARLAFRHGDANALSFLPAVPDRLRADPMLLLDEARFLRRTHAESAAVALWRDAAATAELRAPAEARPAFWAERDSLARDLMADHQPTDAYAVANDGSLTPDQSVEKDFLAGWIALRGLHDAALARTHFAALAAHSRAAISQARAQYWLAHAAADPAAAKAALAAAAAWPLTYYGQKAALESGESAVILAARIAGLHDPAVPASDAAAITASELFRAAGILVGWQDTRRAADFYTQLIQSPASLPQRAIVAEAALRDGLPDVAVLAARLAGRDGGALPQSGWPIAVQPPPGPVSPALLLGVMRQESSFDPKIISPAGAHGLMQLMPQTAAQLAHSEHIAAAPLSDPDVNMRLGTIYLAGLIKRFGAVPFAVAAYDAGPHRVQQWLDEDTPDTNNAAAMTDWIETIPFAETRNYVQRVLENETIYRSRLTR
jgi:soluble lytic murein transglycosylase